MLVRSGGTEVEKSLGQIGYEAFSRGHDAFLWSQLASEERDAWECAASRIIEQHAMEHAIAELLMKLAPHGRVAVLRRLGVRFNCP